ncbi:hypothetical protein [Methyloversatilis discipulorum]|uniref:hypothetical protein n=1 Tax=Methyloversatilis discipulorum TaxID=1119528 RepID=UPI00036C5BD2|nr:hypothetical protein [Methyloversatilis discipulorum]
MAQIPIGRFGFQTAEPAPTPRAPAGAFGNTTGLQIAADAIGDVARVELRDQRLQEAEAAREAKRLQLEQDREAKLQRTELDRAKAANLLLDREIELDTAARTLEERLAAGELSHEDAGKAWQESLAALPKPDIELSDPVAADNLQRGIKRLEFRSGTKVGEAARKARAGEIKTQADGVLDKLGKMAGLPGADMALIGKQVDALDEIGARAYGKEWGAKKQSFKDAAWDAQLNQQAMSARNDVKALDALAKAVTDGEYKDKLDSNRRNTLVAKLEGYRTSLIQRQEAAAARAARAQEARIRKAEAEFNVFQALADKGTILDPAYIDRVMTVTAGTDYQTGVRQLAQHAQAVGGLASQPVPAQQATLDAIDREIATKGRTPELDKRREAVAKVVNGSRTDLNQNGLRAGLERGVITQIAPIDTSSPEGLARSLAGRMQQADTVSAWAGKTVSPLDSDEADAVRKMLGALPAKLRSEAVASIATATGPRAAAAIAAQLDKQDRPLALAFASAGDRTTAGRFTSELIIKGAAAIKDGTVAKDDKNVTGWRAQIAAEVEGAFPTETSTQAVKDAAYYIAAGIAQESGGAVSPKDIRKAVTLAAGGQIIERNGKRIPIPAGMDADAFEDRIKSVPAASIEAQAPGGQVLVGGTPMPAAEFAASVPGQELMIVGPNRYAVIVRGRPVTNTQGKPVIVEVR